MRISWAMVGFAAMVGGVAWASSAPYEPPKILCRNPDGSYRARVDTDTPETCKDPVIVAQSSPIPNVGRPKSEETSIHEPPVLAIEFGDGIGLVLRTGEDQYTLVVEGLTAPPDLAQFAALDLDADSHSEVIWVDHARPELRVWYAADSGEVLDGREPDATIALGGKVELGAEAGDRGDVLLVLFEGETFEVTGPQEELVTEIPNDG